MTDDATYERLAELDDRLQAAHARVACLEAALKRITSLYAAIEDPAADIAREALWGEQS